MPIINAKPAARKIDLPLATTTIATLDEYCAFLGGATDRSYIVEQALLKVFEGDREFKVHQRSSKGKNGTPVALDPAPGPTL